MAAIKETLQKIRAKALLAAGRNVIRGAVEQPPPEPPAWLDAAGRVAGVTRRHHSYVAWADITGWALGLDGQSPVIVHASIDGRLVHSVAPSLPRPDVARAFPHVSGSDRCGFDFRLGTDVLPRQGGCTLVVRAESSVPRQGSAVIATARLERQSTAASRANYGAVWDAASVSESVTNARIAVAGTADDAEYDRSGASTADSIVKLARVTSEDTVVEIGCGTGRVGTKLAPRCARWVGCDVSNNMLDTPATPCAG